MIFVSEAFRNIRRYSETLDDYGSRHHFMYDFRLEVPFFRRRLSAEGAKPESNNRWKMGSAHVCMYGFRKYLTI